MIEMHETAPLRWMEKTNLRRRRRPPPQASCLFRRSAPPSERRIPPIAEPASVLAEEEATIISRERPPFVRPDSKEGRRLLSPDATDRLNFATRPLTPPLPPGLAARRPISSGRKHVPLTDYSPISYASMGDEPLMIVGDGRQMGNDAPQDQTSLRFAAKEQIKERRQQDLDDEAAYYKELLEGVGPAFTLGAPAFDEVEDEEDSSHCWWWESVASESVLAEDPLLVEEDPLPPEPRRRVAVHPSIAAARLEELLKASPPGVRTRAEVEEIAVLLRSTRASPLSTLSSPTLRRVAQRLCLRFACATSSKEAQPGPRALLCRGGEPSSDVTVLLRVLNSPGGMIETYRPAPPAYQLTVASAQTTSLSDVVGAAQCMDVNDFETISNTTGGQWQEHDFRQLGPHFFLGEVQPMDIIDKAPLPYFFVTGPDEGHRKKASTRRDRCGVTAILTGACMVAVLPAPYHKLIMSDPGMERRTLAARCLAALEQTPSLDLFPFHLLQEKERRWLARQAEIRNFEPGEQVVFAARSIRLCYIVESGQLVASDGDKAMLEGGVMLGFTELLRGDDTFKYDIFNSKKDTLTAFVLRRSVVERMLMKSPPLRQLLINRDSIPGRVTWASSDRAERTPTKLATRLPKDLELIFEHPSSSTKPPLRRLDPLVRGEKEGDRKADSKTIVIGREPVTWASQPRSKPKVSRLLSNIIALNFEEESGS
jgi:CRP-like cAMP-binding protein